MVWTRPWFVLLVMFVAKCMPVAFSQLDGEVRVSTPGELRKALEAGPTQIAVLANLNFNQDNWPDPPVVITRAVTIYSPYRVKLDFYGSSVTPARPLINVTSTGSLLLQRFHLRNFLPSVPQNLSGLGPVPALLSSGGRISFKIVVFHILPAILWAFEPSRAASSFWAREHPAAMSDVYRRAPLQLQQPALYMLRYNPTPGSSSQYAIATCYAPIDLRGCYSDDREDTVLVYCLYSFADALRNPAVRFIRIFHDIGLDRMAFNRLRPIVVDQPKSVSACPGTSPSIHMDGIMYSVVVRAALEFSGLSFRGSRSTNFTTWPRDLPVLLSAFDVDGTGSVALYGGVVEVSDLATTVTVLRNLPGCCSPDPSRPNLQPAVDAWPSVEQLAVLPAAAYGNGSGIVVGAWPSPNVTSEVAAAAVAATAAAEPGFNITYWLLSKNAWIQYGSGSLYGALDTPSPAVWKFSGVRVRRLYDANERALCFAGALEQGSVVARQMVAVADDLQLRAALQASARFIQVVADIKLQPDNWPGGSAALQLSAGIIEIRGCHPDPGRRYTLDLSDLSAVVRASGRLLLQGDLRLVGVGWEGLAASQLLQVASGAQDLSPLGALVVGPNQAGGQGSVEMEVRWGLAGRGGGLKSYVYLRWGGLAMCHR